MGLKISICSQQGCCLVARGRTVKAFLLLSRIQTSFYLEGRIENDVILHKDYKATGWVDSP
jgi:hypothetical protein